MDLLRINLRVLTFCGFLSLCVRLISGQTLYDSGWKNENTYYAINNCASGYYIYVSQGWYGHTSGTSCYDSDALSNLQTWCHGKTSCTFYFSNSWFGDPCSGQSKRGYVKWYCARNGGWGNWGTWSTCSLMCGSGTKYRTRSCDNPTQVSPGSDCSGSTSDTTTCNTGSCPTNQLLTSHRGPWKLAFKAPNYVTVSGYSDIYSFYASSGTTLNENTVSVMRDFGASGSVYKSSVLNNWGTSATISAVRLSGYRSGAEEVYTVFNAFGKTATTWMDCSNIVDSTWTDVSTESKNYCDLANTGNDKRNFFINRAYGGCTVDTGWFMFKDYGATSGCSQFDSPSATLPFVRYSASSTYITWYSSYTTGDSMAIFVLEWHMVFKGVQGVTSAAGYLEALWEGTATENDDDLTTKTLPKSPSKTYKSKIVEDWSDAFIDQVKYAFFTSGAEKAWVVFDGRSTTKNSWFTDSKILYSRYTDLTTSMTSDSISGDGIRAFALIRSNGACSAHTAWMFSVDNPSGAQTCSWDQNVQTRPYFLYSSGTTYASCESSGSWNSASFPAAETMGIFIKGWYPVMKFARGQSLSPASSVYNLWTGTYTLNDHDSDGQSFTTSTKNYKSAIVDSWTTYYIKAVRVSFYVSGAEKAYVVFDAHGSDKSSWFNCDKILYTSYNDLNRDTTVNFCSIYGENTYERRFFLEALYNGCDGDAGWFGIMEDSSPACSSWEAKTTVPYPLYSDATGYEINTNMAVADVFVVSVDMENYCSSVTCLNGATCYERGVKFDCVCDGTYYGTFCADRDGVWTDWTAWATCSTTCYAQGTQSRTRTCTNPSQAGAGTTCSGVSSETQDCIPDLRICSSYNTGTVAENTQYTMVCPTGYHIAVSSAFYGLSSVGCSSAQATRNLRTTCNAKTSCTFAFSDTYFTDPCNSYTKQGYATMYCRLDVTLTQHRGPWRLVFKAPASTAPTGYTDLFDLYSSSNAVNDASYNTAAMRDFSSGSDIYKSAILQDWGTTRTISAVKVSVMESGVEAHYVIFNGFGKTKTSFWDCNDIIESSWIDIKTETKNMCTMEMNSGGYKRNFFINRGYGSCTGDTGWLFLKDYGSTQYCSQYDTLSNVPYIMYSPGDTYTTFASSKDYADSLAIFVMEWHMTFKGIEGVVPAAGSLETLWTGSSLENDGTSSAVTLTTAANMAYKSGAVEMWSNLLIDQVRYSYYSSGTEVAYVVFDGRGTTKSTWFASTKILYSKYTDIVTETKSTASIAGDGTRQFALIRTAGACSAYLGWMLALDNPSGAQTCSWDKNVKSRPYFLYSGGTTYAAPESASAWNSAGFPAADVMGVFIKGWFPVFKWANTQSVSPASSVYDLWTGTHTVNEFEDDSFSYAANSITYKSSVVDSWSSYYISAVRVSFYTSGTEQAYAVFDAHSSTKTTWMTASRIQYSSYTDLTRDIAPTSIGVAGYSTYQRRFLAQYFWDSCSDSFGWFGVMERTSGGCGFETKTTRPYPMYSDAGKAEDNDGPHVLYKNHNYLPRSKQSYGPKRPGPLLTCVIQDRKCHIGDCVWICLADQVVAEVFVISLALEDYVPCSSSPCQNSAYDCFNRGPRFECNCSSTYYGIICDRRDGAWTDWTAWSVCTTTCYAYGTQTRTRTCTNPTTVGVGITCPGVSSETITCLPEFTICPEYNTGNIAEGGTYSMICPSDKHIIVASATYSYGSCSQSDATYRLRQHCHGKTSCSITFNDALFGTTCAVYSTTGTAKMYCAENQMPTENRGPWQLAFRVPSGVAPTGYSDAVELYNAEGSLNEGDISKMIDFSSGGSYFKSATLDQWNSNRSISAVRLSIFKSNVEAAYVVFDATGKNKSTWMDCSRIIDSSYKDIIYENQSICDFSATTTWKRNFFLSRSEVDCDTAQGWFFLKDYGATSGCSTFDPTSTTMPYIVYSDDDFYITWKTGNRNTGDSLAIFVLDWDMVFKGVSGVTPSGGTLQGLWDGSTTENDADESVQTLTTTPSKTFKDKAVEDWSNSNIDIVKYSYFDDGSEVAWVRFNGRGTTKSTWFADANILDSKYTDLASGSTATCAVAGDGTRKFAIIGTAGTCAAHKAWMMALDPGGSQTCSWDQNVVTRPYFLYSSADTVSFCETGGSYVAASFPTAQVMGIFVQGWFPVFKLSKSKAISATVSNVYNMWYNSFTENEFEAESFSMSDTTVNYKSGLVDQWTSHYVKGVRVSLYVNGVEKAYVVFDGHATTKTTWLDCSRILYTSWRDLSRDVSPAFCSFIGENGFRRRFYVEYETLNCPDAHGWFGVMDGTSTTCSTWEAKATRPYAMFSDSTTYGLNSAWTVADLFVISVALDNYCDSAPCQNNATCYDRPGTFECVCNGTFYGLVCEHRDGNWTEWSAWATCSTTCWALGSHSRTRTCTNPFPVGAKGVDCSGIDGGHASETKECIPDLPVCPTYSTGNILETASPNTYQMVCPLTHYTMVITGFYGHGSCTDAWATKTLRFLCDGKINCTISFTDSTFGNPCASSSNYGSATLKCVEHLKLTEHRGPWHLAMKIPSGTKATGFSDIASFYADSGSLNSDSATAIRDFSSNSDLVKSPWLEEWGSNISVSAVRLSVIKSNAEVAYIVFDARGKNKTDWMDCDNILDSSWVDIAKLSQDYCSISSSNNYQRHFYISQNDTGCTTASGWLVVKDYGATDGCSQWDSTSNTPYILYSADKMAVTWASGNKASADSLAIYIMEWDMVFKGTEGQVPSTASSLKALWTGYTQENDRDSSYATLTTTPNKPFKSIIVDQWLQYNIDMVKYSLFTEGNEEAWVVFDARSTEKNEWFDGTKILYSRYLDVTSLTKAVCSIAGDGTRAFAVIYEDGSSVCADLKAWMLVLDDPSGATTCSFDNTGRSRPYFIYSSNYTWSYPDSSSAWSQASFPAADTMGIFIKGWFPVMKVAHGQSLSPATGYYNMWTGSHNGINEFEYDAFTYNSSSPTYRSSAIDVWSSLYLKGVRLSFYKAGVEKAYVVFDAHGTDKNSWFSCSKILYTSYDLLNRHITPEYCSIQGESSAYRYFFAAYDVNDCTNSYGWFGVSERTSSGCSWDTFTTRPYAMYSDSTGYELMSGFAVADVFAISVAMDDYCASAPCQMNSTCYNRETRFECICNGTFYGMVCEHRDGNWTEWTAWATCSTTCWALGSHSRTRTCTNPFPVGTKGLDCSGIDGGHASETKECIPDLPVCPLYNSGTIQETDSPNTYRMVCPLTHFTMVHTATYASSGCTDPDATKDARFFCDGNINCTLTFNDATFGNPCPSASNYGSASFYCVEHIKATNHRGPWRLVFKAVDRTTPTGYADVFTFYNDSGSLNEDDLTVMGDFSSGGSLYKSSWLEEIGLNKSISAVRLSVYKSSAEVAYVVFDARGKTKLDWMDCDNIIESNWVDVAKLTQQYCSINPDTGNFKRMFYIGNNDTLCDDASGWLLLKDNGATDECTDWDRATNMPFIKYSADKIAANWKTGNVQTADSMAIYVMEWDMVFKGVAGQVPTSASSLETLWTGPTQENDNDASYQTLTTTPNKPFKSLIVDQWMQYNIEMVKYSFFTSGNEVAFVVFDGRGTAKREWFDGSKIMYSNYLDIPTISKAVAAITGDGTRAFALIHETSGTCTDIKAWMLAIDKAGGATTCPFDNTGATRPYFIYSSNYTWSYPDNGGTWSSASFPSAETMGIFIKGWFPVMKVAHGQSVAPATGIYNLWTGTHGGVNEFEYDAISFNSSSRTYRSSIADNWSSHYLKGVRLSFYKSGVEMAFAVFDAHGTTKTTWFSSSRLLYTNYNNLNRIISPSTFSIAGDSGNQRHFLAAYSLSGCTDSYGWFGVVERDNSCGFEKLVSPLPYAFYSDHTGYELLQNTAAAEVFAISVAMDDYCASAPCQMNSTCYNRETTFECICNGTFYGMVCEHRDGNWTEWTAWATCSTTCWALGSHSRTRNCTNPFPVGTKGIDCSGIDGGHDTETKECIPTLAVCPDYNTGTIRETDTNTSYHMVCPLTHVTTVLSATWGHASCTDSTATKLLRFFCDGKINCTISFTDTLFGSSVCPSASNYGSAVLRCVENLQPKEPRGPWRLVFKVPSGVTPTGYSDIASFYAAAGSLNDDSVAAMTDFSSGGTLFKSSWLDEWEVNRTISAVKLAVYKANKEVAYIVFDAMGKGKMDWMDCGNILDSSWVDVAVEPTDICSINYTGDGYKRNFFVSQNETGCTNANGWLVLKDIGATAGCTEWDTTSNSNPYILYSKDRREVRWHDGNKDTADALAIYVMEWDMVFKGVQGEVSAAGSLKQLWEGSFTENENEESYMTISKSPSKTFKSMIVQQWEKLNIDMVRYAYFTDGHEKAYAVFDGRSTTKSEWFDKDKIMYSNYLDLPTVSKAVCSIAGDSTRVFALIHESGGATCPDYKAWMMTLDDASGATTCSWDKNIQTRPYFLYSSNYTWSYPENGGSWDSALFPTAENMGIFIKGWFPVMKVAHGQPFGNENITSVLDLWTDTYPVNEFDYEALNYNSSSKTYKSGLVETWANHYVKGVRVGFYVGGVEKAYAVFDGHGTDKNSWFDCSKLLYTSYDNLIREITPQFCSITGESGDSRHFYIQYETNDCNNAYGWFGVIEKASGGCSWEQKTTRPYALYSDHTGYELNTNMAVADVFAISVALDNYCDSNPCMNNATCYNRETRFECICNGTFYGMDCAHRDGNWTEWTPWGVCSVTCHDLGTHIRTRTCSEPTTVGEGIYCDGEHWQVKQCIPDLHVCASYDSGNYTSGSTYPIVCPDTHFIIIDSAWYGNDTIGGVTITYNYSTPYDYYWKVGNITHHEVRYNIHYYDVFYDCIDDEALHDVRNFCHRKINCSVEFGTAIFGEPCPTMLKTGNVQYQCIENSVLTEFRGPWRVVFKASSGTTVAGHNDLASLYMSSSSLNEGKDTAMNDFSAGSDVFKATELDEWHTTQTINAVRLSVFKNNKEVGFIVFDAWGKSKTDWMNCDNILDSSWSDLPRNRSNFCNFVGLDTDYKRNFYVSRNDTECDTSAGWILVKDYGATKGCDWDPTNKTMPYIMYAPTNIYTNWSDAPFADSFAISVIDWYMAFKAVQGVSPSAAESLDVLWGGSTLENEDDPTAKTVTKAPNKRVKEKIIEDWDDWVFLEWAKYSHFVGGKEVAYIMFDTRGDMHKDKFFDHSKIVLSSYSDIKDYTKQHMKIEGDGTRTFLVANDTSTCSSFKAWMFVLDEVHGATTCSFDNNVVSRPYFLYSNNGTMYPPESGGSWDSTNFPVAEVMGIFLKGWYPVMSVAPGHSLGNATSIYDLWTGTWTLDEWDYDGIKYTSFKSYKSSMVDQWSAQYISAVRVSFFKSSVERAYVVFDAHGSDKNSWFDCSRILYTNYVDLTRHIKPLYCGIAGDHDNGKHFFIELAYNNCSDYGYFGVIENSTADSCNYTTLNATPFAFFSDQDGYQLNYEMVVADKFQISVALRGYCDSNPCMHGATCYERAARFECVCDGTYYGMICQHRDGNWTEWTAWDTCTTTCYAVGTQERYRNCTNPTTVGDGIYCANEDWQIQDCIPALPICPVYNTGNRNDSYVMVCPWDHYIYIDSTWYGSVYNGSEVCKDNNAQNTLYGQCQGTVNCTILFNAWFDGSSCGSYAPYGYSKMYCARDGQWTNWDPWTWCPVTCAGSKRSRDRYCTNPTQVVPGLYCPDHDHEKKDCLTDPCPVCGNHLSGYDEPYNVSVYDDTTKVDGFDISDNVINIGISLIPSIPSFRNADLSASDGYGYLMLDVNWQIHCCEVISSWEFVPKVDGEIEFQIWRLKTGKKYEVISKVNYTVTAAEVGTTVNYSLPLKQRLAAAQWDVVGWYSPGPAMIGYAPCQGELCPVLTRRKSMSSKPEVGDIVNWNSASVLANKAYALRIYTHPNTVPFVNQTEFSALASDSSPIGTSIISYYIQDDDIGDPLTHIFVETADKFELNTTFDYDIHIQSTGPLPSAYTVYELILVSHDTCAHTTTTTLEVTTYNAPPVLHNLPNKIDLSEATTSALKIYDVDVKDYSDNDSVCCTLAQVIPGSLNFEMKFINQVYTLWTTEEPIFDYSGISNYYKLWVCCSDTWGVTANFLEIDIENVIEVTAYVPPSWFLTAIACSMVPICFTFLMACGVLCSTFFCDAEIEYYYE